MLHFKVYCIPLIRCSDSKNFFQIIIITPTGVLQGLYNGGIESCYKNASFSIGEWKFVIKKIFAYNFLGKQAQVLKFFVQNSMELKFNM